MIGKYLLKEHSRLSSFSPIKHISQDTEAESTSQKDAHSPFFAAGAGADQDQGILDVVFRG